MTTSTLASPASPEKPSTTIHAMRKKKGKKGLLLTLLFLVITGIGVWYFFFRPEPAAVPFIRFAIVDKGDITKSVTATGTLQATTTVQVGSQVSGTIRALHADFNTRVTKGQLVAELDPTFYEASVKAAEANFARASADQRISQLNADRSKELFDKNLVSRAEYDQATTTALDSKSTVQQMQAALDQAKVNLSYTKIHAPISGVVTQRSVDVGQTVAASLNAPVLFIIAQDLTEMEVQANVDEADIGQVKQGQSVTFTVDAFSGEKFHGVVKLVRLNPIIANCMCFPLDLRVAHVACQTRIPSDLHVRLGIIPRLRRLSMLLTRPSPVRAPPHVAERQSPEPLIPGLPEPRTHA